MDDKFSTIFEVFWSGARLLCLYYH